jgi:hypothetical protein
VQRDRRNGEEKREGERRAGKEQAKIGAPSASSVMGRTASVRSSAPGCAAAARKCRNVASQQQRAGDRGAAKSHHQREMRDRHRSSSAMLVCPIAATRITKDQQHTVA